MDQLSEEQAAKVFSQINYSRNQLESDLVIIKDWLKLQQHLPPSRLKEKDDFLRMYLTGCKGSLESAKGKLDKYYSFRGKSEIYSERDVMNEKYRKSCEMCYSFISTKCTEDGDYVFICKLMEPDLKLFDAKNILKRAVNVGEMVLRLREIHTRNYVIFDFEHFTGTHALAISLSLIKDLLHVLQNIFPARIKKLIFINVNSMVEVTFNKLIRPLFTKKLKERVFISSRGPEELYQFFDKSLLPKDFGGYHSSLKECNDYWNELEISMKDWFVNELSEETDETRRIKGSSHYSSYINDSYFGVHGSLKKLAID